MSETIFRRRDDPSAEEYLEKVEAVMEMDSTDSSFAGTMNSAAASDHTTITVVHNMKKDRHNAQPEQVPNLVSEETEAFATDAFATDAKATQTNAEVIPIPAPIPITQKDISSYSNRTASTNPVTPDTSLDGATDPQQQQPASLSLQTNPEAIQEIQDFSEDKHQDESKIEREGGETEREADKVTPTKDNTDPEQKAAKTSSERRHTYSDSRSSRKERSSRVLRRKNRSLVDDDESSSDDDSSYFATHLPSPKSGRSFSISSNASNGSAFSGQYLIQKQGSDASLSFSDESDEDHHHHPHPGGHNRSKSQISSGGVHLSPVLNPNRSVADMNLYPQRITRMHSVSSLVSSASSDNRAEEMEDSEGEGGHHRRRSYTGDDSVTSSLPSIASTGPEAMHRSLDQHPVGGYYVQHHSYHPQAYMSLSPPQQQQQYYAPAHQPLTNQQLMAWATPNPSDADEFEYTSSEYTSSTRNNNPEHSSKQQQQQQQQQHVYGMSAAPSGSGVALKSASSGSLNYNYSEDEAPIGMGGSNSNGRGLFNSFSMLGKQHAGGDSSNGGPNGSGLAGAPEGYGGDLGRGGSQQQSGGFGAPDSKASAATDLGDKGLVAAPGGGEGGGGRKNFKVYWQRWIMLFYMSVLNLLSDWTCYSVAPISLLTEEAFGEIDPERLVVVFLGANAVASACEPMLLARLGLRRTVLLGSLLLMIGSIIKSGGLPPIMDPSLETGHAESSLYLGFFIVGLSQPLYQCTPALLSASWFPEEERTMATGVALNANQLGIGFAFIFGTLLVSNADDIIPYFGLLSQVSTLCFIGTLIQFDDAPPTPPSASAKVVKGNLNFNFPNIRQRYFSSGPEAAAEKKSAAQAPTPASTGETKKKQSSSKRSNKGRKTSSRTSASASSSGKRGSSTRQRRNKFQTANAENGLSAAAPSSAHYGSTAEAMEKIAKTKAEVESLSLSIAHAPSPADNAEGDRDDSNASETPPPGAYPPGQMPGYYGYPGYPPPPEYHYYQQMQMQQYYQQQMYAQQMHMQQQQQQQQSTGGAPGQGMPPPQPMPPPQMPYFPPPQQMAMPYSYQNQYYSPYAGIEYRPDAYDIDAYGDEGAEPTVTVTNHHLDIDIRDDQVIRSLHACMIRQGFSHALAAFTVSGIVINTLSTYMDYLVRLNGAPRSYTGIVGGTFQFGIMLSSLIMGKYTDKTRAYYSVTTGMLVIGAFGLAECGVSLDSNRGSDLRWSLLLVAVLVGPLQPISTELGVEVAYPLSENTVLVIQQLFSNLLSALFIPFFKSLKDIGTTVVRGGQVIERPEYTFSFYLLIVLHTLVTVYFATFNGRYLRYEHELQKKEEEEAEEARRLDSEQQALRGGEYTPLMANATR